MNIGVIGTGRIGGSIGRAWAKAGHDVLFGTRDPGSKGDLPGKIGTYAEAAAHGEVILLAIPGNTALETVRGLNLAGKIVIDATNGGGTPEQPVVRALAEALPAAHVYKAFNTLGWENFQNAHFDDGRADLLFVGPETGRATVETLIDDVGLNPFYVGGLDQTAILDAALSLWFGLSRRVGRHLAFRILHDGE
jgi:predicted dinucleotide-binding enzyme